MSRDGGNRREGRRSTRRPGWGLLESLVVGSPTLTFFITIGTPTVDVSVMAPNEIPIFVRSREEEDGASSQFFIYIQELIDGFRRGERMRKELIRHKPSVFVRGMEPKECTVCMGRFRPKQFVRRLDCEHEFHKRCIDRWLVYGDGKCPLCRKEPFLNGCKAEGNEK